MGTVALSTRVIFEPLNASFLLSSKAVDSPNTPEPIMRMDDGIVGAMEAERKEKEAHTG